MKTLNLTRKKERKREETESGNTEKNEVRELDKKEERRRIKKGRKHEATEPYNKE